MLHLSLDEVGFSIITATCLNKTNEKTIGCCTNTLESFKNNNQGRTPTARLKGLNTHTSLFNSTLKIQFSAQHSAPTSPKTF